MKKILSILLAVSLLSIVAVAAGGCGDSTDQPGEQQNSADQISDDAQPLPNDSETVVIKIGVGPTPHAEILDQTKGILAEQGYELDLIIYNDYILPNTALDLGDLDANFFQHGPYLENFNEKNGTNLVSVSAVHFEPLGIYAGKTASLDALTDGAVVAVPNDPTNEARALLLLESHGLITVREGAGLEATVQDIVENPLNLKIHEIEAAQVPRALPDVDIAVINGNYALDAGLGADDVLLSEDAQSAAAGMYANVIVVNAGNENNEAIQALVDAVQTDEIREFINSNYNGAVVPVF